MSLTERVFKGASWMAAFDFGGRLFSWAVTVVVARMLVPGDYGLLALATIYTAYAMVFSEMGLGTAIIQRARVTDRELSSVFWFGLGVGVAFGLACFPLATLTAATFAEPRVVPLTRVVAIVFLLNSLQIVPVNLLRRNLEFKRLGWINFLTVVAQSAAMLAMAWLGAGVWTLIGGSIVQSAVRLALLFPAAGWWPQPVCRLREVRAYLSFGVKVALGGSLFYIYNQADKFLAGRAWTSTTLGYYTFALELAQIPTVKITALINQVSFSAFSRLQGDPAGFNRFYLNILKVTATLVLPLFVAGAVLAPEMILLMLGEKWQPLVVVFRFLCLAQILTSLNAVNDFAHNAQGRPGWMLANTAAQAVLMTVSFAVAVPHGLNAMVFPWLTTYLVVCLGWIYLSIRKIGIGPGRYCRNLAPSLAAATLLAAVLIGSGPLFGTAAAGWSGWMGLAIRLGLGAAVYGSTLWVLDRAFLTTVRRLLRPAADQEKVDAFNGE